MTKIKKVAHFRLAMETPETGTTLQQSLKQCKDGYLDDPYPQYNLRDNIDVVVARHELSRHGCFLHLVTFEARAGAAVISMLKQPESDQEPASIDEAPAPEAKEFILSQLYLLCRGDDVIYISHNGPLRDSAVSLLLTRLIKKFSGRDPKPSYLLLAPPSKKRLQELIREGIRSIDLKIGNYRSTLEHTSTDGELINPTLREHIMSYFTDDPSEDGRTAAANIKTNVILRPGRQWDNAKVKMVLEKIVAEFGDNDEWERLDEGFAIVTRSGMRITHDSLRVKHEFEIEGNNRIIFNPLGVQDSLVNAFIELTEMGVIDRS